MNQNLRKHLTWIPAILIASAIFLFSSQSADDSTVTSDSISRLLLSIANTLHLIDLESINIEQICLSMATAVRKSAHMLEFSALHLSLLFALYHHEFRGWRWLKTALFLTAAYACTDEFHQLFVPGRAGRLTDVCIDSTGALLLTIILSLYLRRCSTAAISTQKNG